MYLVKIHYYRVSEKRSCNVMKSIARGLLPLFDKAAKKTSGKPKNHPTEKENHLNQPSLVGFHMLIF